MTTSGLTTTESTIECRAPLFSDAAFKKSRALKRVHSRLKVFLSCEMGLSLITELLCPLKLLQGVVSPKSTAKLTEASFLQKKM